MREILNAGIIQRTSLPEGWNEKINKPDIMSRGWQKSFSLAMDPSVEIVLFSRGEPIDKDSANYFKALLKQKPAANGEEKLTPAELLQLQMVMGFNSCGDNQYTNPNTAGSGYAPAFEIKEACTRKISKRSALFIKGVFSHGKHYAGIFYEAAEMQIEEAMIQAPSSRKLKDNFYHFQHLIDNVEWNKLAPVAE
jgi:hypothetical protein